MNSAILHAHYLPIPATPPPLSLYVHIPWCVRKCPYCDFNSHHAPADIPEQEYVSALLHDLELALPLIWGRRITSIFIGGGTPSLFSGAAIDRLLCGVRALLPLEPGAEITLEANPGTAEAQRFFDYRAAGVNRLSLGIQSFNDRHLTALGRVHDSHSARMAIDMAAAHFDNFNLDLMYGLPDQSMEACLADLHEALSFQPSHLSCYHLSIEPNTTFHLRPPVLPDDDTCADMQQNIEQYLAAAGYAHYETSAFARQRRMSRHNLNYWQFGDYLGIGAGAHSKLSGQLGILRQQRQPHPRHYMEQCAHDQPVLNERRLTREETGFEFMMNALRLVDGVDVALFTERTNLPLNILEHALRQAEQRGLLSRDTSRLAPTLRGQRFLNDLLELFLPDHEYA
ncbi:radical SAM family heme chaperone HemW [Halothiobacillus sp.]|uniref:radical SAM family heme chaperone HemW n=1 Tax=Halothiobacillus sp. TaxID=1891311 RepID=UPI002606E3EE|nr:radical SAM family heme chaperone HemW [Halothiobacillus sp.]